MGVWICAVGSCKPIGYHDWCCVDRQLRGGTSDARRDRYCSQCVSPVPWEFRSWMGNRASTYHENRKISDCAGHLEIQMRRPDPWMERTGQRLSKCTQE